MDRQALARCLKLYDEGFDLGSCLPGVGKTAVCRRLAERCLDLHYVDLGKNPDFRNRPIAEICIDQYRIHGDGRSLITEGFLPKAGARDKLAKKVLEACGLDMALIVGLDETDMEFLSTRRRRSSQEYELKRRKIEFGSRHYDYIHYMSTPDERASVDERAERLIGLLEVKLNCVRH